MLAQSESSRRSRTQPCPVLVLGLGNILLRDEGVGVRVIEAMRQMDLPSGVEVFDGATAGLDLLEVLAHRRRVIVVDAFEGDGAPGTVWRLGLEELAGQGAAGLSLHEIGLREALVAAERLGCAPGEVVVVGIKPKEVGCGLDLSAEIARLVPGIIKAVLGEVEGKEE